LLAEKLDEKLKNWPLQPIIQSPATTTALEKSYNQ
jgi:hypothetical protein